MFKAGGLETDKLVGYSHTWESGSVFAQLCQSFASYVGFHYYKDLYSNIDHIYVVKSSLLISGFYK